MSNIMKKLSLTICGFLVSFNAFCMEWAYVRYDGGVTKTSLQPFVDQIHRNPCGAVLLGKINELYTMAAAQCSGIVFKTGPQTSFSSRRVESKAKTELVVEIASFVESLYPCLHGTEAAEISAISAEPTPFWITLAHELIHLKHKLEELNKISVDGIQGISYSLAKTIGISDILIGDYRYLFHYVPELLKLRLNMSELWPNLEERRTVIGPDIDGVCEASIRKSAGLPSRFIYQDKTIKYLEETATVERSLASIPLSIIDSITLDIDFCVLEGIISPLTPIDILLSRGILKEQIIKNADNVRINEVTRKILSKLYIMTSNPEAEITDIISAFKTTFDSLGQLVYNALLYEPKQPVIEDW